MGYVVTLYQGTKILRSCTHKKLAVAGKMYANPGMMVSYEQYEMATRVSFAPEGDWSTWNRDPHHPAWFLGVEGSNYFEVKDLERAGWKANHIETMQSQMKLWYPDMDPWRAMEVLQTVKNHVAMGMSLWVTLEEIEAYPRKVELAKLARDQREDQNEG